MQWRDVMKSCNKNEQKMKKLISREAIESEQNERL
jgi:hypothetical protein